MEDTHVTVRAVRGGESIGKSASDGIVAQPGHITSGNVKGPTKDWARVVAKVVAVGCCRRIQKFPSLRCSCRSKRSVGRRDTCDRFQ